MALNYADQRAVRPNIVPRCAAIVAGYAGGLLNPEVTPSPTTQQTAWAREAMRAPDSVGDAVSWYVLPSAAFIASGSGISDQDLQFLVVTAVNAHFIVSA